ncbi:MAG: dihydroorotase [Lysobacterales bacterium]
MSDWIIRNATLVSEGRRWSADVRIRTGRIDRIGGSFGVRGAEREFDAAGRLLLPGLIDDHVHFREPGLEYKATIATESRAAVAGGITSFMEMPNTDPSATDFESLRDKRSRAAASSLANYAFYLGATNDNLEVIKRATPSEACGVKVFLCASTGNLLVDDPEALDAIFRESPLLVLTHCEDSSTVHHNQALARAHGRRLSAIDHPLIRSREACITSTRWARELALRHDTRLHVLHVSTAEEAAMFAPGPIESKRITAETCVQYLHFDADDYPRLGNRIKCNPAIKLASDRLALIAALSEGRIDVLATDHAPHTAEEKSLPYADAPSGLPLVQHALQVALRHLPVEMVVERFCHAPARLFGLKGRGFLHEGAFADLTLIDPTQHNAVRQKELLSKCAWSPFEGETLPVRVAATWVNGHLAWDGERLDDSQLGMALETTRGR